ncbi:DUF2798 domain-containing protein [Peribacillus loiseleuriae]|uniref:DUF2798 domain-containing protein n=1 Tax=Peribacillus loiseleuriae TaxID=1679170 RepID=A0A0K9GXH3_9BACI|nr:DUF2798 domain-containing protein [Peribacillus loiseleuriae]KMY51399.1 hypothetical protein AC625_19145 [Peribacillus loiseleuriae]
MKINSKYRNTTYRFLSAFSMSLFMSFMIVSINYGYNSEFLPRWLKIWPLAFVCAFVGSFFLPKIVQRIMSKIEFIEPPLLTEKHKVRKKQL